MARGRAGLAVGVLAVLLVLVAAGWWFRGSLARLLGRDAEPVEVSAEAAASAERKLQAMQPGGEPVRLSSVEVTSLLRYRAPGPALEMVREPTVQMAGDTVRLSGLVPTDRLPRHSELDRVRDLLPDTAKLVVRGGLRPLREGRVALQVESVDFANIPIPRRYYPAILERLGRRDQPGLDPSAIGILLPPTIGNARVEGGYLVLTPASHR